MRAAPPRDPGAQVRGHARPASGRRASWACSGVEIPEEYGGLGLDKVSGCLVSESVGPRRQLRGLLHGPHRHRHAAHRLLRHRGAEEEVPAAASPAASGSAPTRCPRPPPRQRRHERQGRAVLSPDGKSWILNGEKMWLTNARLRRRLHHLRQGGRRALHRLHHRQGRCPGVSLGAEEKKTGIKGSSTRPLILQDAVIPKENLLGEIGKGHKIAFNILNIGRFKLARGPRAGPRCALRTRRGVRPGPDGLAIRN